MNSTGRSIKTGIDYIFYILSAYQFLHRCIITSTSETRLHIRQESKQELSYQDSLSDFFRPAKSLSAF